jgi:hypothetical protein
VDLACCKAKDLGYPHELVTMRLPARHDGLVIDELTHIR